MTKGQKTGRNNKLSRVDKAGWWHCITANCHSELEIPRQPFNCGYSSRFTLRLVALANGEATANGILKWKCLGEMSTSKKPKTKEFPMTIPELGSMSFWIRTQSGSTNHEKVKCTEDYKTRVIHLLCSSWRQIYLEVRPDNRISSLTMNVLMCNKLKIALRNLIFLFPSTVLT